MNCKKAFSLFLFILLSVSLVSATRYIKYDFKEGTLYSNGYTPETTPVTDVSALGFVCGNSECSTINGPLWDGNLKESQSKDYLILTYPENLQSPYGYGVFFFSSDYVTWEQANITFAGTLPDECDNPTFSNTAYLTKANLCSAQVDTLSLTNTLNPGEPLTINATAQLDANAKSALNHAGPIDYVPPSLKDDYYSLFTNIELTIIDSDNSVVHTTDKNISIGFSEEKRIGFSWTPEEADDYTAIITSYVTDEKCRNSQPMGASKDFTVLENESSASCYTFLDNLSASPISVFENDIVTINIEKKSNMINSIVSPLPTNIYIEIFDENNSSVYSNVSTIPANIDSLSYQTVEYQWISTVTGTLKIVVYGIAAGCPYDANLPETETINFIVNTIPDCLMDSDCGTNAYSNTPFCRNENSYDYYNIYTCNNAGTSVAYCSDNAIESLIQICPYGCSNGLCINESEIDCFDNSDCDDINSNTEDVCHYPGTLNSYCTNEPIDCFSDSDCGLNTYLNTPYCSNNNSYDYYITYTCNNAGTASSTCSDSTAGQLIQICPYGCSNGLCINESEIDCFTDTDCDDNQAYTEDKCHEPGTINSYCTNEPIDCFSDSDCGLNSYLNSLFCSNNNSYDYYITYTCNNAGTASSTCSDSTAGQLIQICPYGCSNGLCINESEIDCFTDDDCDDSQSYTEDKCHEPGTINSYCTNEPIVCFDDSDCGLNSYLNSPYCQGNNVFDYYITYTCNNAGTVDSTCSDSTNGQLIEICTYGCYNNACINESEIDCFTDDDCDDNQAYTEDKCHEPGTINSYCTNEPIVCFDDSDCGLNSYLNTPYCSNNNSYDYYITYTCNNAGTVDSTCSDSTAGQLIQICPYGCSNGLCINESEIDCFTDDDCDDNQAYTEDKCHKPGTINSYCTNEPIVCFDDSDCPANGFIRSPFCKRDNLYGTYRTYTCLNQGLTNSYCDSYDSLSLIEECAYGCFDEACKEKRTIAYKDDLYIQEISFGHIDRFTVEDQMYLSITLINEGPVDLDDVGISVLIYDFGLYFKFGNFEIKEDKKVTKTRTFDIPFDVKKGEYDARIVISNDDIRRVVHREITLI